MIPYRTPEEAAKTWCPWGSITFLTELDPVGNRLPNGEPHPACMCLGPRCAVWEEAPANYSKGTGRCGAAGR